MEPKILFEDDTLLVIDKPSGLVVNRAESVVGETVQDWVEKNFKVSKVSKVSEVSNDTFIFRSGIVHRIDKETSGCLLIAKTQEAFVELQRQFKAREVEKMYMALVHGKFERERGIINAAVGRLPWRRERFGILSGGRDAETQYKVISSWLGTRGKEKDLFSLVEFYPKTGRTHQIRVHAKYLHHALVSDEFYAGRKTSRRDREWCSRLFLHATKITFTHPVRGKRISVESPLPQDLKLALSQLTINQ